MRPIVRATVHDQRRTIRRVALGRFKEFAHQCEPGVRATDIICPLRLPPFWRRGLLWFCTRKCDGRQSKWHKQEKRCFYHFISPAMSAMFLRTHPPYLAHRQLSWLRSYNIRMLSPGRPVASSRIRIAFHVSFNPLSGGDGHLLHFTVRLSVTQLFGLR